MFRPLTVLPLHLACQLLVPQNCSNVTTSLAASTPLPKTTIELPDGYAIFKEIGVAYKFYKNQIEWDQARKVCIAEGGHLAITDTFRKVEIVGGIKGKETVTWVGIHRLFDIDEWTEVRSGLPPTSVPWSMNPWISDKSRRCGAIWKEDTGVFATLCTEKREFVCEISIFKD